MNRSLITIVAFLFCSVLFAQDVHYTLVNPRNEVDGPDTYHLVDVLTYSNIGFKLGSGQLYINYDTTAFGQNIHANGNLEILLPDSSVLNTSVGNEPFEFSFYGDIVLNDNTFKRFSYSWQHDFSNACLFEQNVNYYTGVLFTIKIKFKTGQSDADPGICLEGSTVYVDQTYTACGPVDCNTSNCFDFPGIQLVADFYSCSECSIVYSTNDDGPGTLRNALGCSSPGDTIRFAPNLLYKTIELTSAEISINKDIQILAKDYLSIVVNGDGLSRTFDILVDNNVVIEGIHIVPGTANEGKGIRNNGVLVLRNVQVYSDGADTSLILNQNEITIEGTTRIINN